MSADGELNLSELAERLQTSRQALLDALSRATEPDFERELEPGVTVLQLLATLAPAERAAASRVERLLGGLGGAVEERPAREPPEYVIPPQVVHDLAAARHRTMRLLERLRAAAPRGSDAGSVAGELESVARREGDAAQRIAHILGRRPAG